MENEKDFKTLEQEFLKKSLEYGREMFVEFLRQKDEELSRNRDRKQFRSKGKRTKTICTVLGDITFERRCYKTEDRGLVFLLDDYLGLEKRQCASPMLCEHIANLICTSTYRTTAEEISNLTGTFISHGTVWNAVQEMGGKANDIELADAAKAKNKKGTGDIVTKVLFEEQDGVYLSLQGKDRKKHGSDKEMKVAISYDGWQELSRNRFKLTNKTAVASFEKIDDFYFRKEGAIAAQYNVDEIQLRVLNGDGAEWIKKSITDDDVIYQLDPFHRNKPILELVNDSDVRKQMMKLLYDKDIDTLLAYIDAMANSIEDEEQIEKYRRLFTYFSNNKEALISYKRRDIEIPEAPEGKTYRQLGTMESNVFSLIGCRMKRGRMSWSIKGGENLAKLLTLKSTDRLDSKIEFLASAVESQKIEKAEDVIFSAYRTPERVGKGYNGIPTSRIPDLPFVKPILEMKPLFGIK